MGTIIDIEWEPCLGAAGGGEGEPVPPPSGDQTNNDCSTCGATGAGTETGDRIETQAMALEDSEDCKRLRDLLKKSITNQSPKKVRTLLNELKDSVSLVNYELGYFLNPIDIAEQEFNSHHFEGNENTDEVLLDLGTNAISVLMHIHYNNEAENKIQLSVPSLTDLYQIYQSISIGNIFSPNTFTFFVVTEHGTKYALQIDDSSAFLSSGFATKFFIGWEFDNIRGYAEDQYGIDNYNILPENTNTQNEKRFAKFLTEQNLGINLFKANDDFTELTKLDYNNGTLTEIPCN